jgi:hypothetical protein
MCYYSNNESYLSVLSNNTCNLLRMRRMQFESFNDIQIFRPSFSSELELHQQSEVHLRSRFSIKRYDDKNEINSILQHQFDFYSRVLKELLPLVASRNYLEFVLHQFDLAAQVEQSYKSETLNKDEEERWAEIGPVFRRSAKYIAEQIVLLPHSQEPIAERNKLVAIAEKIWICAEEIIDLYMISDLTFSIFPEHTVLEIRPPGEKHYFHHDVLNDWLDNQYIQSRARLDLSNRHRFIPEPSIILDVEGQDKVIGGAVKEAIGVTYQDAVKILANIVEGTLPAPNGFPTLFLHQDTTIAACAEALSLPRKAVEKVVAGFTISKQKMELDGRQVWKPKQEYRAYSRAFFEYSHPTGAHFAFSKEMAQESLILLIKSAVFGKFPAEWKNQAVTKALSRLANAAGGWLEKIVEDNFRAIGFYGLRSIRSRFGNGNKRITIPPDIGEIDYLGYSTKEKVLVIGECKLVRDSFEPKLFQEDISDFVYSDKAYLRKFKKKVQWVQENLLDASHALASSQKYDTEVKPQLVAGLIITFFPTVASYFIDDFPCVSLTEFMIDYESTGKYPYNIGISPVT